MSMCQARARRMLAVTSTSSDKNGIVTTLSIDSPAKSLPCTPAYVEAEGRSEEREGI
jgi:hypothetical protein